MLAISRSEGGGVNSAVDAMAIAVQLSPRNETYLLNMAVGGHRSQEMGCSDRIATRLKTSRNAKLAAEARDYLAELPNAKKYGLLPPRPGAIVKAAKPKGADTKKASHRMMTKMRTPRKPAQNLHPIGGRCSSPKENCCAWIAPNLQ